MKSLKSKAMLFASCFILIAISTLGLITYQYFQKTLKTEIHETLLETAEYSGAYLSYFIEHYMQPLETLVEQTEIKSMDWSQQKKLLEKQSNPYYLELAIVGKDGIAKYINGTELNLKDRDYIQKALLGESVFSEVIISRFTNQPVIMIALPIYKNASVNGVLIARLEIDFLEEFAKLRHFKNSSTSYIISDKGSLISFPKEDSLKDSLNLTQLSYQNPEVTNFKKFIEKNSNTSSGFDYFTYKAQDYLTGFTKVAGTSWTFYISVSEKEALKPLDKLRVILFSGLIITLIICAFVAWIFIKGLTKPIESLDKLMSQGASGNLNIRFESHSKDEIGRLGHSFNRMIDKIKSLTQYDPLTGLLNQYVLEKNIYDRVSCLSPKPFGLLMVAVSQFSLINETHGYVTGDLILIEIANRIKKYVGTSCEIYRYKGDEFVVLCSGSDFKKIHDYSNKSLRALIKPYTINEVPVDLNINMGLYKWDLNSAHEDSLKSVAHAKNYAKELGGNQIQVFDPEMHSRILIERKLESDLLVALRKNQFYLLYQPLFSVTEKKVVELEALIRWKHPDHGLVFPDEFIPLAEKSDTIIAMDFWVIEKVFTEMKNFKKPLSSIIMSINITSKTFEAPYFIAKLNKLLEKYKINPKVIQFEITERMVIENIDESIGKLNELRSMGISIALDDFGIGYSSLSYIVRLPVDRIKIDRSFIQNMHEIQESKLIVSTIINLCKSLNFTVIAEGVEIQEEFEYLKKLNCDIVQGYLLSKALPMIEVKEIYFNT